MARGDTIERDGKTYVDMTPTPEEYRRTLDMIITRSDNAESREWAIAEYKRVENVTEWATN